MPEQQQGQGLTVKGESIERVYGNYQDHRYMVNRRYQRKLVWTLEEKKNFIDSIIKGYPVPIILLADKKADGQSLLEIIDGMQRLNAIMGFIENEYPVNDAYFDLNTMAATKALMDSQALLQKQPALSREMCVRIASYTLPLSIYEFSKDNEVDEVFRRINSGGRKLSRQELRIAGSVGHFSHAVRTISAKVRGDVTSTDNLFLNEMKRISIGSRDLPYGIDVDEVFWIRQGVLTKEQVRESADEEIVADILAYMLLDPKPSSRSEFLDDYFGFGEGEASTQRLKDIELAVQKYTIEVVSADFQRVLDVIKLALNTTSQTFGQLLFGNQPSRAPRYFQVVFLAFHKLVVSENKEVSDYGELVKLLSGLASSINIQEGGRWGSQSRVNAVNATAGALSPIFVPTKAYDPAQVRWITQLENILSQSYTEQPAYDFKQGFIRLDGSGLFDEDSFEKILKTLVGIANIKSGTKGYVLIGIAEKGTDAKRVQDMFSVAPRPFERFFITGVEHEAIAMKKSLDQLFQLITDKVKQSKISDPLRDYIARNVKLVRYYEKSVFIFDTQAQQDPSNYDGVFLVRRGNSLEEVPAAKYAELFRRFQAGY
ncbi:MAG: DUF262 domain-containing protein [Terracidiphilus sp.]|jgi:hypothetical protein